MKHSIKIYSPENMIIYTYTNKYLPNYIKLLDPTSSELDLFREKIESRITLIKKSLEEKSIFTAEACLIDQVWDAEERNMYAISFLDFIDKQCQIINGRINNALRKKIKTSLLNLMINFDSEKSRYLDNIGEICVLAKIFENSEAELIDIEYALENGKSIDYEFDYKNEKHLVEVYSIKFEICKLKSPDDLLKFIEYRESKKVNSKLHNLENVADIPISFVEILWGSLIELEPFYDVISKRNLYNGLFAPLMCVGQFVNQRTLYPVYGFLTINQFIDKYRNFKNNS